MEKKNIGGKNGKKEEEKREEKRKSKLIHPYLILHSLLLCVGALVRNLLPMIYSMPNKLKMHNRFLLKDAHHCL